MHSLPSSRSVLSFLHHFFHPFLGKVLYLRVFIVLLQQVAAEIGDPISCTGRLWSTAIDIYPAVPLYSQDACTQVLDDRGINRGLDGVCGPADSRGRSSVAFSIFPEVSEVQLQNGATWATSATVPLWVAMFCRDNCWCSTDVGVDPQTKPKGYPEQSAASFVPLQRIFKFDPGREPRFESPKNRVAIQSSSRSMSLRSYIQRFRYTPIPGSTRFQKTLLPGIPVALDPLSLIQCNGVPLPQFPNMPPPYTMADFHSPIKVCATALSGGDP